ncbi:cytidine deaminase [Falsiroseomonas tokyonensis]|uniref:Cytidine deaminase n=1 Tax=Falsiroseomonas tokyonensis TaxID=430521 RepID=A0ABV7BUT1_9PROT|nr:cytidine deaminase [Falsiroseomonas tokyonensis]MBU8539416.1 cytidine deaminase [Falsiroseomonas tokyonensis]
MDLAALMERAEAARAQAYAPYSRFQVGAALLCEDGSIQTGCNMENASFGATICAERVALGAAIARGQRRFRAIAVAGPAGVALSPCGLCRQVISEFSPDGGLVVAMRDAEGRLRQASIAALLPDSFGPAQLRPG